MKKVLALCTALLLVGTVTAGELAITPDGPSITPNVLRDPGDVLTPYDVTGTPSWDALSDPSNVVVLYDLAAAVGLPTGSPVTMTGIGWDVNLTALGTSWLSELRVYFDDSIAPDLTGLFLTPGVGNGFPGSGFFTSGGIIDLTDNGIPDILLPNGVLRMEFFEGYDDANDVIDGMWDSGALTIASTPEPASLLLLALGALTLRRR